MYCPFLAGQVVFGRGEHGAIIVDRTSQSSWSGECVLVRLHHIWWEQLSVLHSLWGEGEGGREGRQVRGWEMLKMKEEIKSSMLLQSDGW